MDPQRLGKYQIVAKIGQGAMGQVHKAHDPILNRDVAIKTMASGVDSDDDLRRRFHREAQSAARLNHPNIITIYDFGEEQGQLYIAMELLDGRDLKDIIVKKRSLTLDQKLDLMEQVCDGLAFAHEREVIHRDLKPANIHVQTNDQVKIVDFGLARIASSSELTGAGMMLGTPNYMSPEQVKGEKVSARSDVFAMGVVFYELLSGRKAFESDSVPGILFQVVQHNPRPLEEMDPTLEPLSRVLETAMAKDPSSRYANAGELWEAVREARAQIEAARAGEATVAAAIPARDGISARTTTRRPDGSMTRPAAVPRPSTPSKVVAPEEAADSSDASVERPLASGASRAMTIVPFVAGGGLIGLILLGGLAYFLLRASPIAAPSGGRVAPSARSTPASVATTPPAALEPSPAPAPTATPAVASTPPAAPVGPSLADAEKSLRFRDYRAAVAIARNLGADPGAQRLLEQAQRSIRRADELAGRVRGAIEARDAAGAASLLGELRSLDPRRPDASSLADRLAELQRVLSAEAARPTAPPVTPAPTPIPTPIPTPQPVVEAPTPRPTQAAPPAQSEAAAKQAIRGVIDEYRAAFERRDVDALKAVQPGIDYTAMKEEFEKVTGYQVRIDIKNVTVQGSNGAVEAVVTYMPQPKPARKLPPQPTIFHLRRAVDVWLIERLEVRR